MAVCMAIGPSVWVRLSLNHEHVTNLSSDFETTMPTKTRCSFMIDRDILQQLREIQARTGVSTAEQIREGIRWWLNARRWPEGGSTRELPGRRSGGV